MATNLLIGYPAIPAASTVLSNLTAASGYSISNTTTGARGEGFQASTTTTDSLYFNYDLGASATKSASLLNIARAKLLKSSAVTGVVLRQCAQSAFTPSDITGLKAWWDATRGITKDGSNLVSQWNDLSGNGYHLTATSTAQPTWTAASSGVNSNPYLDFDGSANIMRADSLATFFAGSDKPMTVFAVYQLDTTATTQEVVSFNKEASNVGWLAYRASDTPTRKIVVRDDSPGTVKQPSYGNGTTSLEVASIVNTGIAGTWYVNGTQVGSAAQDIDVTAKNHTTFSVGGARRNATSQTFLNGKICEVIIYDSALNTTDRQAIEAYLTAKWVTAPLYTDTSFSSATLTGQRAEDYTGAFTLSSATRHYWLQMHSTGSKYPFSKAYISSAFDMGCDPNIDDFSLSVGTREATNREPRLKFSLKWLGITNTIRKSFNDNIYRYRDVSPVVLYDANNYIFNGATTIFASIVGAEITNRTAATSDLRVDFEECI